VSPALTESSRSKPPAAAAGLEQTILPSPNISALDPTPKESYQTRLRDARGTLAEQYHVNSRLRPWELSRLPSEEDARSIRDWFLASGRAWSDDHLDPDARAAAPMRPLAALPMPVGPFLQRFCERQGPALYAADLMLVLGDELLLVSPAGEDVIVERSLGADAQRRLAQQVRPTHRAGLAEALCVLAVTTVPWRHMVLYGERGFRRALMETGVLITNLCGLAMECGLRPTPPRRLRRHRSRPPAVERRGGALLRSADRDQRSGAGGPAMSSEVEAPLAPLIDAIERSVQAGALTSTYAAALLRLVHSSEHLHDRDEVMLAHLVHASARSAVAADGAQPGDLPTLTAPDLRIEHPGVARSLPDDVPPEAEALHELLLARHSVPYFGRQDMPLKTLGAMLELALGAREVLGAYNRRDLPSRMFPSAGGLQPIDFYVFANRVTGVAPGIYFYNAVRHELVEHELGDFRTKLVEAAIHTDWLFYAPVVVALVGNFRRVSWKYGSRGYRFLNVDTGVATMNLYLAGQALGLHGNAVAAFDDDAFNALLRLDGHWEFTNLLFAAGLRPPPFRA
jgi:SagB-type dehydrogenase family enzyme